MQHLRLRALMALARFLRIPNSGAPALLYGAALEVTFERSGVIKWAARNAGACCVVNDQQLVFGVHQIAVVIEAVS